MDSKERLRKSLDYLKKRYPDSDSNDKISVVLGYRSKNYVSDLLGGKDVNQVFLDKLYEEYGIRPEYIKDGKLPMEEPNFVRKLSTMDTAALAIELVNLKALVTVLSEEVAKL